MIQRAENEEDGLLQMYQSTRIEYTSPYAIPNVSKLEVINFTVDS